MPSRAFRIRLKKTCCSRFSLPRRGAYGEAKVLATAINDMADRIEKQMKDQRELLADRIMKLDADPQEQASEQHILENREGAVGGSGTSGGGCGCN